MVGSRANNADFDAVFWVPACITIKDIDKIPSVEVVDGTLAVDFEGVFVHLDVDRSPPDIVLRCLFKDDTLVLGTGKTTLSADPKRQLIGDDEHVWSDEGVFNIEGGCYAKTINLSAEKEPEIYNAIRFGSILENVVYNPANRFPDYDDISTTENTRCAYPIEYIPNAKIPCVADSHPVNIIMLTCDAYGVLPPVSKLTSAQAQYHFLAGYTSKTPGTEDGVVDPTPTFSTCYSAPFIVLHPSRYASMLATKMEKTKASCWLINTGWVGGKFGTGSRCPLKYTRAIINAIHSDSPPTEFETFDVFGLQIPTHIEGVPDSVLDPKKAWDDGEAFEKERKRLANMFVKAFKTFESGVSEDVRQAGPSSFI